MNHFRFSRGQSLVELIVAIGIFSVVALGLAAFTGQHLQSTDHAKRFSEARAYANEALEATRAIRNRSWRELTHGSFGIERDLGFWDLTNAQDYFEDGSFFRSTSISPAQRDGQGNIVESGGTVDPQ